MPEDSEYTRKAARQPLKKKEKLNTTHVYPCSIFSSKQRCHAIAISVQGGHKKISFLHGAISEEIMKTEQAMP